jgi:hypothetical protein
MKFFQYDKDNECVALNDIGILAIKEFAALMETTRNKTKSDKTGKNKEKAFKEFQYIYLFLDWESPYFSLPEQDRHEGALQDSGLTNDEFNDPEFKSACKKYDELQNSSIPLRLLKSAMNAVESQIYYLNHIDLNERDPLTGKPIFKSKDLIAEIKGCKDLIVTLNELEQQVKKEIEPSNGLRGNMEAGTYD